MDAQAVVDELRRIGVETARTEVKAATGGCPTSVRDTLSAFANTSGGTILLGVDDATFQPVAVDASRIRDALAGMAANDMTPPVRGEISIEQIDGDHPVVVMEVPEIAPEEKPCYITTRGKYGGSFIRVDEGDRRLTDYEVDRLTEQRTQPTYDREPVPDATMDDLDPTAVAALITRMQQRQPRAFAGLDTESCLRRLNVVCFDHGILRPTLAGLLTFGTYPQQFHPQLGMSVVVHPTVVSGDTGAMGERFTDNQTVDGSLAEMVERALEILVRHMSRASVVEAHGRTDRLEYPLGVVRELLVNAVMHRDYSPGARGTQVQVELFPDRLVVRSPGGFYGPVDPTRFGQPDVSSSRNTVLARLLSESPTSDGRMLAENRGSGIPTIFRQLNRAGMLPPDFDGNLTRVQVTVPHHALMTPEVLEWISSLGQEGLSQHQTQALALLHAGRPVRNQTLQNWGAHPSDATRALGDLVHRGLVLRTGGRRGAQYLLNPGYEAPHRRRARTDRQEVVLTALEGEGELTSHAIAELLDVSYVTAVNELNALIDQGLVEATAPPRSRNRRYRPR